MDRLQKLQFMTNWVNIHLLIIGLSIPAFCLYLLALVQLAGQLYGHTEPPELHRGAVLLAGQKNAVRLDVTVDDIIVVTILQSLQSIDFR